MLPWYSLEPLSVIALPPPSSIPLENIKALKEYRQTEVRFTEIIKLIRIFGENKRVRRKTTHNGRFESLTRGADSYGRFLLRHFCQQEFY